MYQENKMHEYAMDKKDGMHHHHHHPEPRPIMEAGCACPEPMMPMHCPPVIECPQERIVNRQIFHDVPHIQPIHTRIVNHHIYRHHYQPNFTCSEENVCTNVVNPGCGCR